MGKQIEETTYIWSPCVYSDFDILIYTLSLIEGERGKESAKSFIEKDIKYKRVMTIQNFRAALNKIGATDISAYPQGIYELIDKINPKRTRFMRKHF